MSNELSVYQELENARTWYIEWAKSREDSYRRLNKILDACVVGIIPKVEAV